MKRIRTVEIGEYVGHEVWCCGWLHAIRQLGGITFLVLRDGWGQVQAVTEDNADLTTLLECEAGVETVLCLEGTVVVQAQAPGGCELHRPRIRVLSAVNNTPPAVLNRRSLQASLPTMLDNAVLLNRHPKRRALFRMAAVVMDSFRQLLTAEEFTEIQTPKIVASATESGANVFRVDYFGRDAFLAQSPQFYKQIMVGVLERVFEVGPVFRAEPHATSRHLSEYVSLDVEFGFIEDHFDVMVMVRKVLHAILTGVQARCAAELELLEITVPVVPTEIPWIHFTEGQELIWQQHGVDVRGQPDLSPQDERWLGQWAKDKHDSDFLFVTGYPMAKRPFYTHPDPQRPGYSNSFDLLFRGTELITGGQRLHHYQDYLQALEEHGLATGPFAPYLQAFEYGMPPHGGFAIGLERFLMQLTAAENIRLTTLFPRDLNRINP